MARAPAAAGPPVLGRGPGRHGAGAESHGHCGTQAEWPGHWQGTMAHDAGAAGVCVRVRVYIGGSRLTRNVLVVTV
jgi:hypothetical protein